MPSPTAIARLQKWTWILIFGGLFALVFGIAIGRVDPAIGWPLGIVGGVAAAVGVTLIWVRSRLRVDAPQP